jgi:hypothetical protein
MSNSYYNKSIIYEFNNNPSFVKIEINKNNVISNNQEINKIIQKKIQKKIDYVVFYISLYDFGLIPETYFWETIKHIDRENLPIFRKDDDLMEFLEWLSTNFNNNSIETYETSKFTKRQYVFDDQQQCLDSVVWDQTNPRHPNFNQLFFHAADQEDIERYGYIYVRTMFSNPKNITIPNNIWFKAEKQLEIWNKFKSDFESIKNTMNYLFHKMKKGILIGIRNNKLAIFLPFSKYNYQNDFYTELYFDEKDKKMLLEYERTRNDKLLKQLENTARNYFYKYKLKSKDVLFDRRKWVANDCFFRYESYEGDKAETIMENMFVELCKNRDLPDSIFFLNIRDHPVLHKDLKDSYTSIVDRDLDNRFKKDKYAPILSVGPSIEHADIPLVNQDDWLRISKKFFPDDCKNGYVSEVDVHEWDKKIDKAVFRGSATGCANDESNIRIKASLISLEYPEFIDAGIISFNRKLKKKLGEPLSIIDTTDFKTVGFMTLAEKAKHKYILNLDGHVAAFRLGHEFSLKSVILIPWSPYYVWFSYLLQPFVHFVPIEPDLSNLIDMIKWCRENDKKCKEIAENGYNFYKKYLEKDGIFDYLQYVLHKIQFKSLQLPTFKPSIALITVYRNDKKNTRLYQKRLFVYWLNKMLSQICSNYTIIVVEQQKDDYFNIGKLKNIGYDYLKKKGKKYDNYIFSDIDTIPDSELVEYYFKITDSLNALATSGTRYEDKSANKKKKPFAGALISCTSETYEELNGYPNNFIGWGDEDTNLLLRLYEIGKPLYENKKGKIIDIEEIGMTKKSVESKLEELNKEKLREEKVYEKNMNYKNFRDNGLSNLNYSVLFEDEHKNNYHIIVDLELEKAKQMYPNDYEFKQSYTKDEYRKIKNIILNDIKQIPF